MLSGYAISDTCVWRILSLTCLLLRTCELLFQCELSLLNRLYCALNAITVRTPRLQSHDQADEKHGSNKGNALLNYEINVQERSHFLDLNTNMELGLKPASDRPLQDGLQLPPRSVLALPGSPSSAHRSVLSILRTLSVNTFARAKLTSLQTTQIPQF